jgi:hypothetical protein
LHDGDVIGYANKKPGDTASITRFNTINKIKSGSA